MRLAQPVLRLVLAMAFFAFPRPAAAQAPQSNELSSLPEAQIREATSRILKNADKANCKHGSCKILVTDFSLPSGLTSELGIQLADQFSREVASQQSGIEIIDRSALRAFVEKERIPSDLLSSDKAARWLGKQFKSTTLLTGKTQVEGSLVRVQINLLPSNKDKTGPSEVFTLPLPNSKSALNGFDPIGKLVSGDKFASGSKPCAAGVRRATLPTCTYCPDFVYSKGALAAKFGGSVLLNVSLSSEGKVVSARIVRGAPFGLNELALNDVRQWRLKPSTCDGEAVAASTMIEMTVRLTN